MKKTIPIIFFLLLGIYACSVHPPEPEPAVLPEITMEGLNTFGCTVEGEVYEARQRSFSKPSVEAYISGNALKINTWDQFTNERFSVVFYFLGSLYDYSEQRYYVFDTGDVGLNPDEIEVEDPDYKVDRELVEWDSSFIELLRLDQEKKIISGTFQFDAETVKGDTIQIRKGRFDVRAGW